MSAVDLAAPSGPVAPPVASHFAAIAPFEPTVPRAKACNWAIEPFQTFESPPSAKGPDSLYCQKL